LITARIPETFQVQIFKLYLFPSSLGLIHSKSISFKSVSVLFSICLGLDSFFDFFIDEELSFFVSFNSIFAFFDGGSSLVLFSRFFLETLFIFNISVFLPDLTLEELAYFLKISVYNFL